MGQADLYIDDEGLIVENTVGYDEDGEPQVKREENPALLPKARMRRDNLRVLKDTGVIGSADDRIAGATEETLEVDVDEGTKEALRSGLRQQYEREAEELRDGRQADHNTNQQEDI
jgi:hypothetical protein